MRKLIDNQFEDKDTPFFGILPIDKVRFDIGSLDEGKVTPLQTILDNVSLFTEEISGNVLKFFIQSSVRLPN